jgi:Protein of unknown function (DUF4232)
MSSDLRGLMRDAAKVPSTDADVAGAWRRGRRMRVQRRALGGLAIVAVIALGAVGIANILPSGHSSTPVAPATTIATAPACAAPSTSAAPAWASTANPPQGVPHLESSDGNVLAYLFTDALRAGSARDQLTQNKILWIVRQPRNGQPLRITATLPGSSEKPVRLSVPANSGPGEIYPSYVNVPKPGCWHVAVSWNAHESAVNLEFVAPSTTGTAAPLTTTTTAPPTPPATSLAPTTCQTANLGITITGPIGSAGHFNYEIQFRNNGASACVMTGFPGVSFLDSSGHQIGVPAGRNPVSYTAVTVAPGATGYAHLSITDPSVLSGCPATPVAKVRIFPPNETADARIGAAGISVCATQPSSTIDPVLNHSLD